MNPVLYGDVIRLPFGMQGLLAEKYPIGYNEEY
jgi:hypothetical protein